MSKERKRKRKRETKRDGNKRINAKRKSNSELSEMNRWSRARVAYVQRNHRLLNEQAHTVRTKYALIGWYRQHVFIYQTTQTTKKNMNAQQSSKHARSNRHRIDANWEQHQTYRVARISLTRSLAARPYRNKPKWDSFSVCNLWRMKIKQ